MAAASPRATVLLVDRTRADPGLNAFQKLLLAVLPKIAPNLRVGNGLTPGIKPSACAAGPR